jgi:YidC/Oxa1 family membrane protein insertase
MEKRLPFALLLCLLFVVLYNSLFPTPVKPPAAPAAAGTPETGAPADVPVPGSVPPPASSGPAGDAPETSRKLPPLAGNGYVAQFETRGAGLTSVDLTEYHPVGSTDPLRVVGAVDGHSLNLLVRDFNDAWGLDRTNWDVVDGTDGQGHRQLVFSKQLDNGLKFVRTITDRGERDKFDLSVEVVNTGGKDIPGTLSLVLQPAHGLFDENDGHTLLLLPPTALAAVANRDGDESVTKWAGKDLKDGTPRKLGEGETLVVAGSMVNYFATLVTPHAGSHVALVQPEPVLDVARLEMAVEAKGLTDDAARAAARAELEPQFHTNAAADLLLAATPPPPGGAPLKWEFTVFAGPKDDALVKAGGYDFLHPVLEDRYGRFAWINHGLLAVLRLFYAGTGNWGVAIILLTIVVRLLLFPLNRVNQSGMLRYSAAMQRLKPQLEALKAKYKNNTRKYNEEQMKLLKEEGVRPPLGGCLLMFLQLPVWVSLYQILRTSIELRQAPFAFWVHDLSKPDHMPFPWVGAINLLPILMAGAQIIQMRLQPPPADAQQAQMQKVMGWMMPVMMLFFLYTYASGLSLYIFTSSLLGIVEYRVIRKLWPPGGPAPVAVPAVNLKRKARAKA